MKTESSTQPSNTRSGNQYLRLRCLEAWQVELLKDVMCKCSDGFESHVGLMDGLVRNLIAVHDTGQTKKVNPELNVVLCGFCRISFAGGTSDFGFGSEPRFGIVSDQPGAVKKGGKAPTLRRTARGQIGCYK